MQSGLALYKVDDSGRNGTQVYHTRGELQRGDFTWDEMGKGESGRYQFTLSFFSGMDYLT